MNKSAITQGRKRCVAARGPLPRAALITTIIARAAGAAAAWRAALTLPYIFYIYRLISALS